MTIDYASALNERIKGTMAELIGVRITEAEPRRVAGTVEFRDDLRQPYGLLHGGALMTLMDTLAGMASALNVPEGKAFTTIEFKINFLRGIRSGSVTAEAVAVHIGRSTHVWQVAAHDEKGRQVALATLTQLVLDIGGAA